MRSDGHNRDARLVAALRDLATPLHVELWCPCGRDTVDADGICGACERDLSWREEQERWEQDAPQRAARYAEATRRYELAVTVECPYCGSAAGRVCRTAGPSGARTAKGIHVHADRYRAAADPHWKAAATQGTRDRPAAEVPFAIDCPDCDTRNGNIDLRYCDIHRCRGIVVMRGTRCKRPGESASFPYCRSHLYPSGIPTDFLATEEMLARAASTCPDIDAERETARFRQYWHIKRQPEPPDPAALDWSRAWFSWMADAQQEAEGRIIYGPYSYSRKPGTDQLIAASIIGRPR